MSPESVVILKRHQVDSIEAALSSLGERVTRLEHAAELTVSERPPPATSPDNGTWDIARVSDEAETWPRCAHCGVEADFLSRDGSGFCSRHVRNR